MPEFHAHAYWALPNGSGGRFAGLTVETDTADTADDAFTDWCDRESRREHEDYCYNRPCPYPDGHPYNFDEVIGPVDKEDDDTCYPPELVEVVDSGTNAELRAG